MPRTRAAAEAVSARRNVLTDTDLLSLVFEQLDAPSLCRAATVCKKWRATETNKHWRALLASRWPNSVELQDELLNQELEGASAMASKYWFKDFVEAGAKADFSFELEIRFSCERLSLHNPHRDAAEDLDGMALVHQTFYGPAAERQPRHTVNGIYGRANHGLEFECDPECAEALTSLAQNYCRRQYQRNHAQVDDDDLPDFDNMPVGWEEAEAMLYAGRGYLQARVTVWYASDACGPGYPEQVSVQRTFNMEFDEDDLPPATYAATDENDWITIPLSFNGQARRGVSMPLTMRVVPEPTETGAEWKVVFDIEPLDRFHFSTSQMLTGIKDKLIADLYDESKL